MDTIWSPKWTFSKIRAPKIFYKGVPEIVYGKDTGLLQIQNWEFPISIIL